MPRDMVVLAAFELSYGTGCPRVIARERQCVRGGQRIHQCNHVSWIELCDEAGQLFASGHRIASTRVIVIQEDRDEAHIVPCGLALLGIQRCDRDGTIPGTDLVYREPPERVDRLDFAVLLDLEVGRREVADLTPFTVRGEDIYYDCIDARPEGRRLRGLVRPDRRGDGD